MRKLEEAAYQFFVVCRLWVAIDYGHILVHVFQPEVREFYSLETLWEDAKITNIQDID